MQKDVKTFFDVSVSEIDEHKNVENVIRFYLAFLPPVYLNNGTFKPYGNDNDYIKTSDLTDETKAESVLDIGSGITTPYKGNIRNRTKLYKSLDIRPDIRVDLCEDVCNMSFPDKHWQWGWCSETLEHIKPSLKEKAVNEILRCCEHCVFTYPTPLHETFYDDKGHSEVLIDWDQYEKTHEIFKYISPKGRNIIILKSK